MALSCKNLETIKCYRNSGDPGVKDVKISDHVWTKFSYLSLVNTAKILGLFSFQNHESTLFSATRNKNDSPVPEFPFFVESMLDIKHPNKDFLFVCIIIKMSVYPRIFLKTKSVFIKNHKLRVESRRRGNPQEKWVLPEEREYPCCFVVNIFWIFWTVNLGGSIAITWAKCDFLTSSEFAFSAKSINSPVSAIDNLAFSAFRPP